MCCFQIVNARYNGGLIQHLLWDFTVYFALHVFITIIYNYVLCPVSPHIPFIMETR